MSALIEVLAYISVLALIFAIAWVWDRLEKQFAARRRRKDKYICKNREMRRLIRKKDMYDFYNIALRHNNAMAAQAMENNEKPIRKLTGILTEQFYSLSKEERDSIL